MRIPENSKITKNDPGVIAIKDWVDKQYTEGRTTGISEQEMWTLAKVHYEEWAALALRQAEK